MRSEFAISIIISLVFLSLGFLLLHYGQINYGISFFVFLPFIIGYISGNSTIQTISIWGHLISLSIFFVLLYFGGLEGMVCILMAIPLIVLAIAFGIVIKYIIKTFFRPYTEKQNTIKSTIIPFLIFLVFGFAEEQLTKNDSYVIDVTSEIILPYSPMEVYDHIKSVDTLDAEKPFLMRLDLPIPQKCVLVAEKVGALRTCYFKGGKIVERITELKKGEILKMDIIDYQLNGKKWLGFKEASYIFEDIGVGYCKLIRSTTYTSELYPRFYWRTLEKIGIQQQHEYVFKNLNKDLERMEL
ncbi:hypothetical protein [Thalassobellus suaedae]|uniref:Polyketide cyclase n=1 Tax=Thalassobellus suaedae TaxID=3074124 RepID=A0ABY9XZR7_9FLAO|nr:hypothetical protein RHP49_09640 [Flavobacteriaceae bacterium HL-DH10]